MLGILFLLLLALSENTIANTNQIIPTKREVECLTRNIYFESRGEPKAGQIAVGWVTLNRVKSEEFPDTICKVVYQKGQFSWTALKLKIDDIETYLKIKQLSIKTISLYNRNVVPREVKWVRDSLYFKKFPKGYKLPRGFVRIGNHAFSPEYWKKNPKIGGKKR